MSNKNKKLPNKKYLILYGIIALLILVVAFIVYFHLGRANSDQTRLADGSIVNTSPPTKEERQAGDRQKKEIVDKEDNPVQGHPAGANVIITYGDLYNNNVEVGAYISNVLEEGGVCKLSLKHGAEERTATVTAVKSANTTNCPVMSIPKSQLSAGVWSATVSYTSSSLSGTSQAKDITIN